jgi:hypothetical protein
MPYALLPLVVIFPDKFTVLLLLPEELIKEIPETSSALVTIFPMQVVLEIIPLPGSGQSAKLLKLKSMARQNKKHWDKLKDFLI